MTEHTIKTALSNRMDGTVFKVRENPKVVNKTIYLTAALNRDGKKEALGMWLDKDESVKFLLGILIYVNARSVKDTLVNADDNLNSFTQTIKKRIPRILNSNLRSAPN